MKRNNKRSVLKKSDKGEKEILNAGNRTRVSGVKILNPSRLDYIELLILRQHYFLFNYYSLQSKALLPFSKHSLHQISYFSDPTYRQ